MTANSPEFTTAVTQRIEQVLLLIAGVMAVVGLLGLTSSMSTSVIERTREFGIMRSIGARSRTVLLNVISEGVMSD